MKLLQINVTANWGSHGKIAEEIGKLAIEQGWESWIAYGRGNPQSASHLLRIGNNCDMRMHGLQTRLFDNHGLASKSVTKKFINKIRSIKPDIIHLHNIHGYYLNYPELFKFLKSYGAPIVWTLHDCWPLTGHCSHFTYADCNKWETVCQNCPEVRSYPSSLWIDNSKRNHKKKKEAFLGCDNMTLVPVSYWLEGVVKKSFLAGYPTVTIHNGVDLSVFKPSVLKTEYDNKLILGVASIWSQRKGLDDFIKLRKLLPKNYEIVLIGLKPDQIADLPEGISGIQRTENINQLVDFYSKADVFVNPTLEDNFPTTNLEALACGTPVITYNTGGSPEAIDNKTGVVVDYQDVNDMSDKIQWVCQLNPFKPEDCRERTVNLFDKNLAFPKYISLYKSVMR